MEGEELRTDDLLTSFPQVWQRVVTDPRAFFESLPPVRGLQAPLVFALVCLTVGGFGLLLFGWGIKGMLALIVLGLLRLFVVSAIFVLVAQNLFEGRGDYEATFRALGYSSAPAVAIGLPVIRYFAAIYGLYISILGLARAHSFDTVRATLSLAATVLCGVMLAHAFYLGGWLARFNPLLR
jgi:hypothetical protein